MDDVELQNARMKVRLKQARYNAGLSLNDVADALNVAQSTVARWENGRTKNLTIDTIIKLADMYKVSSLWLIGQLVPMEAETEEHAKLRDKLSDELLFASMDDLLKIDKFIENFIELKKPVDELEERK